jgi:trehalose-phosphatase
VSQDADRSRNHQPETLNQLLESECRVTYEGPAEVEDFFSAFSGAATPFLLLDYDGTLASFRLDRFQARPWAGVRDLLTAIQRQGRTRMVMITGRPAHEIAPLLGLDPPLEVWGLHGAEHLLPDGRRELEQASFAAQKILKKLRETLNADSLGGRFEDKANGVVMHWRGASPARARIIQQRTRALFDPFAGRNGLFLLEFEAGVELRVGCDKGGAVEKILQDAGANHQAAWPVAYLGDDFTDESAFSTVNDACPQGLSVLVRREWRETEADIWLRPPAGVKWFLQKWLQACSSCSKKASQITERQSEDEQIGIGMDTFPLVS